jgi:hypothetical protein
MASLVRLSPLAVLCAAAAFAPLSPGVVERWYATGVYPRIQRLLTPFSNLVPFAWLDVIAGLAAAAFVVVWWRALRRGPEPRRIRVGRALGTTAACAMTVYLAFLLLWGFNYRRVPMADRLVLGNAPAATEQVVELGREVAARVNLLHPGAHRAGWRIEPVENRELRDAFAAAQRLLTDAPPAVPGPLKPTMFGPFFRWTGVDGMVNPFGLEVLANPDLLPFERPFVAAHEWAHLAGYADESEANFVGWLTTVRADAGSQYSGWLYLYWQVAGELPAAERADVAGALSSGPRADLAAIAARLQRGDLPALRRATWKVYDGYLKANRVEAGVRSYGAVVSLVLRARFEDGWRPVRRPLP